MPSTHHTVEVIHTRVFAAGLDGGNPCPVILDADGLSNTDMQNLAREFGLDCAFVLHPRTPEANLRIRYFVPDHEMGISGHASIAAATVACSRGLLRSGRLRLETISGLFNCFVANRGEDIAVTLEQKKPIFGASAQVDIVARALQIAPGDIDLSRGPIQAVSVSRPKLLVPLRKMEVLDGLTPDFERLWCLCETMQVSGFYPFVRTTDKPAAAAEARQYPLRAGFLEDAATGVAAAALGAYLTHYDIHLADGRHEFGIAQGYAMGQPSLIDVVTECMDKRITATAIRGTARLAGSDRVAIRN